MKVAVHVGQLLQRTPGGIGRYIRELVAALPATGTEVMTFAAGDPSVRLRRDLPHFANLGHPYAPWRYELWHRLRWPPLRLPSDVDVVHATSLAIPPSKAKPLVVSVHDVAFLRFPEHFTRHGISFHRQSLDLARREAAVVVVASESTRDDLVAENFDRARIHVVPHGVRAPQPTSADAIDRQLRWVDARPPFVLFVGTVEPRKGVTLLAEAVRRARDRQPDLHLVIAGTRGWGAVPGLEAPWIRQLGHVDERTLDALYLRAALCALPSRYEGFGLPALEAMARGCPLLAADTSSLTEVVGDAGVLLPPDDVDAWRAAIETVADDRDRSADLVAHGLRRAAEFTWQRSAEGHLAAYAAATRR